MQIKCDRCGHTFSTGAVATNCPQCDQPMRVRNDGATAAPKATTDGTIVWASIGLVAIVFAVIIAITSFGNPKANEDQMVLNQMFVEAKVEIDPRIVRGKWTADGIELTVAQEWHLMPKQIRLQSAQDIVGTALTATNKDTLKVKLVDVNGNVVGGFNGLTSVWVTD